LLGDWFDKHPSFGFSDFQIGGLTDTNSLIQQSKLPDHQQPEIAVVRDMRFTIPRIEDIDLNDISKIKLDQKRVCDTLFSFFPTSKVLIITRGYKALISANYSQYIKEGGTYSVDDIQKFTFLLKELFDYSFLIETYCEKFGKENVIILPFELLKENSSSFFQNIENSLQIPNFEYIAPVLNPSINLSEANVLRQKSLIVEHLANRMGSLGKRIKAHYIEKRRRKAFEWDSSEISATARIEAKPLVDIDDSILAHFVSNSSTLINYPTFQPFLSKYGIK
jgi:hypothetical protein